MTNTMNRTHDAACSRDMPRRRRRSRRRRNHRRVPLLLAALLLGGGALLLRFSPHAQASGGSAAALLPPTHSMPIEERAPEFQTQPPGVMPEAPVEPSGEEEGDWKLLLINRDHPLPEDFAAPELTQLRNRQSIDSRAYPELQRMFDDARAQGYRPLICSSFRTWDKQTELFQRKVRFYQDQGLSREEAETSAAVWVARPGTSEHQAGLAVDIVSEEYQILDEKQADTPLQQWLMEHSWEYGFILRYPTEKSELTGVGFEPWHYRYVGVEAAKSITQQGLCLEEYINGL